MLLEKIKTPGLSHYSYIIGSGRQAAVIDPRRDCDIYLEKSNRNGLEITHIFETHRNEDLVSGAAALAGKTGADVYHGPHADGKVEYARTTREGDCFDIGSLKLEVLETPGHTDDHIALAIHDPEYPEKAVGVFTGDALFVGDVGRTDFYPERRQEVAAKLYDSLWKIIGLGDQAIIFPAHGAGSVCGAGMSDREFSTVGHERANNPMLQITDKPRFVEKKIHETHYYPPYFSTMERLNLSGARNRDLDVMPPVLSSADLASAGFDRLVDIRSATAFAAAQLEDSLSLPLSMISAFAGWFLDPGDRLVLVAEDEPQVEEGVVQLARIGFDNIAGCVINPVGAIAHGASFRSLPTIDSEALAARLAHENDGWTLLDVRSEQETSAEPVAGARHVYIGHLNERWQDLDPDGRYTLMCGSGIRATIAASWLRAHGFGDVDVYLGSAALIRNNTDIA